MEVLVLIKEVPDMNKVKFDREKGVVDRSSAKGEINPFDENALQAAIDLKDKGDVRVSVMTMGPPKAEKSLRVAYAKGADDMILLTDRTFGGADTYATSMTLAAAVKNGKYDLIVCGEKSVDGDTAQVGAEVAEILGIPHAYYVEKINSIDEEKVEVVIENLGGEKQIRTMKLPALISVTKNVAKVKLPTVNRKIKSLSEEVCKLGLSDLNTITKEDVGFSGSPTKVSKIEIPKEHKKENLVFRDDLNTFSDTIQIELKKIGILGRSS